MSSANPTTRLEVRIAPELKATIERAAAALGLTLTDYSISRLVENARADLKQCESVVLSDRDRDLFLTLLSSDEQPNEAMKRAAGKVQGQACLANAGESRPCRPGMIAGRLTAGSSL